MKSNAEMRICGLPKSVVVNLANPVCDLETIVDQADQSAGESLMRQIQKLKDQIKEGFLSPKVPRILGNSTSPKSSTQSISVT